MSDWVKKCPKFNGAKYTNPNEYKLFGNGPLEQKKVDAFLLKWSEVSQKIFPENAQISKMRYECKNFLKELAQVKKELVSKQLNTCENTKEIFAQITKTQESIEHSVNGYIQRLESNSSTTAQYTKLLDSIQEHIDAIPQQGIRSPASEHK